MPTAEKGLSKKCMANLPKGYFGERIENSSGNGTADLVISHCNVDSWIELKCAAIPRSSETHVSLKHIRLGQVQWHRRKARAGCQTWFLIQIGSGNSAIYVVLKGKHAKDLRAGMTVEEMKTLSSFWTANLTVALRGIADEDWAYARG